MQQSGLIIAACGVVSAYDDGLDAAAIRIKHEGRKAARVVFGMQTPAAIVRAAVCERSFVKAQDPSRRWCREGDMKAITRHSGIRGPQFECNDVIARFDAAADERRVRPHLAAADWSMFMA